MLIDFKDPDVSITGERYCETLERLRRAIEAKHPRQLRNGVILLPHIASVVTETLHWETLKYPNYSRDISSCDFHAFGLLKSLKGRRFLSDADVQPAVSNFFQQQKEEVY